MSEAELKRMLESVAWQRVRDECMEEGSGEEAEVVDVEEDCHV